MKKRSTVFFELEAQSNFLKNISVMDQVINSNSFTPNQSKLLKIRRNAATFSKVDGISVEDLNFDAKKYGDEFNKSKYVTMYQKSKSDSDRPLRNSFAKKKSFIHFKKKSTAENKLLLNKIDENNLDLEVFENNLKNIIKNHIEYQVFIIFFF